jgi:3-oxoacyl-[acyl-carrier-protein] synthase II
LAPAPRRVVLTGAGVVSSLGADLPTFWRRCLAGDTVVEEVPAAWQRASPLRSRLWSPLGAWERETPLLGRVERKQLDGTSRIALQAAIEALGQAGLSLERTDLKRNVYRVASIAAERAGVFLGTGIGGLQSCLESSRFIVFARAKRQLHDLAERLRATDGLIGEKTGAEAGAEIEAILDALPLPRVFNPFSVAMTMPNGAAATLAIKLGLCGPCPTFSCACASGTVAIGRAFRALRAGECDFALAGGVELLSDPFGCCFRGFDALGVLVTGDRPAASANRPFDRDRTGFLFSEGGGAVVVLEDLESASRRRAPILAEVCGYGESCDAYHVMGMAPDGAQIRRAVRGALADAGFAAESVDYVNTHGTGTPANDALEADLLAELFPNRPRVNSTKSLLGHSLGASGALEAVVAALTLHEGVTHPSRNLEQPIADLAFATGPEPFAPQRALSQSFAFGGQNAVLALARYG